MSEHTYNWKLSAYERQGRLWLKWHTNAPFRAQQGQIRVYKSGFPDGPKENTKEWSWDNEHGADWDTRLDWGKDWSCAWIAEASPNGPYVYVTSFVTTGESNPAADTCE